MEVPIGRKEIILDCGFGILIRNAEAVIGFDYSNQ